MLSVCIVLCVSLCVPADVMTYYLTCNGTNPLAAQFETSRDVIADYTSIVNDISTNGYSCNTAALNSITTTNVETSGSLTEMEGATGCGELNPRIQGMLHGVVCDEAVRGLFICLMVGVAGDLPYCRSECDPFQPPSTGLTGGVSTLVVFRCTAALGCCWCSPSSSSRAPPTPNLYLRIPST